MKNALITGASGGMGLATAKRLISDGYEVYGLDLSSSSAFDHFHFYPTDLTKEASVQESFDQIKEVCDGFDLIVHFAGIYDLNSLIEIPETDYVRIFDVNVFGPYRVNKAFLPLLRPNAKIIITTSELAPLDPLPFTGIYAITKSALDKYAYSLRMELQLLGYQVVVLRPGAVDTGMIPASTSRLAQFAESTTHYDYNAKRFEEIVSKVEAKKIPPEKIAALVSKIAVKKKPKYVYAINRNPLLRMLNILPRRTQNRIIKKTISK